MKEAIRLYRERNFEQALREFLNVHVESDDYPELSYYLGLCYTQLEKYDEAVLYLEQVVTSELGFAQVYQARMVLGYIYAVTSRYRLAEFEFNQLMEEGYESAKVFSALAFVAYQQGKAAEAISLLEKALELEPNNANALNSLGFVMADQGIRVPLAINYCKRAVAQSPKNAAYLDSLAWCYHKIGRSHEARELLLRASSLAPKSSDIQEHLRVITSG